MIGLRLSFAGLVRVVAIVAALAALMASGGGCAGRTSRSQEEMWGPFRGRFVDADTGQPIRGGVAYVVWYRVILQPVHSRQEFYAVQFAVTDDAGEYVIPALSNPPLFSSLYDGPFHASVVPGHQIVEATQTNSHTTIRWRPFSRIPEAERRYGGALYTGSMPDERRRTLLEQINAARRQMGLPPFRSLGGSMQ